MRHSGKFLGTNCLAWVDIIRISLALSGRDDQYFCPEQPHGAPNTKLCSHPFIDISYQFTHNSSNKIYISHVINIFHERPEYKNLVKEVGFKIDRFVK